MPAGQTIERPFPVFLAGITHGTGSCIYHSPSIHVAHCSAQRTNLDVVSVYMPEGGGGGISTGSQDLMHLYSLVDRFNSPTLRSPGLGFLGPQ